jgi:hypothetical protein
VTTKDRLGFKVKGPAVIGGDGSYELRESAASYKAIFGHKNESLRLENIYHWDDSV